MRYLIVALLLLLCATTAQAGVFVGFGQIESESSTEFDIVGATYYAVAPAGYEYTTEQDTNYSTRKYNTLAEAEAGISASPSTPSIINIIGSWSAADTTAVTITGSTFSSGNYLMIRTVGEARHAGVYSTGKYRHEMSTDNQITIGAGSAYIWIDGLIVKNISTGTTGRNAVRVTSSASGWLRFSNNIILGDYTNGAAGNGIRVNNSPQTTYAWNNIIYNMPNSGSAGIFHEGGSATAYDYNNTVANVATGIATLSSSVRAKNNALFCANGLSGTFNAASTKNASPVASDTDVTLTSSTITDYFESASDFHIKTAATYSAELIGQGADLDADSDIAMTTDIDSDERSTTAPDISADED